MITANISNGSDTQTEATSASETRSQPQPRNSERSQKSQHTQSPTQQNVGPDERVISVASGAIVALLGLARRDLPGILLATVGGGLLYRGATGYCHMYAALDINTNTGDLASNGIHVAQSCLIDRPAQELYDRWRNFEQLPSIMSNLQSVRMIDDRRSHWIATAPVTGTIEWDAEITLDEPGSRIDWHSLPDSPLQAQGSVRFEKALGDRGTNLLVLLDYLPPLGQTGHYLAKLVGKSADSQIKEDLRSFKRQIETGEVPTVIGQSRGTCLGQGKRQHSLAW